jgi:hypothetical protein
MKKINYRILLEAMKDVAKFVSMILLLVFAIFAVVAVGVRFIGFAIFPLLMGMIGFGGFVAVRYEELNSKDKAEKQKMLDTLHR